MPSSRVVSFGRPTASLGGIKPFLGPPTRPIEDDFAARHRGLSFDRVAGAGRVGLGTEARLPLVPAEVDGIEVVDDRTLDGTSVAAGELETGEDVAQLAKLTARHRVDPIQDKPVDVFGTWRCGK